MVRHQLVTRLAARSAKISRGRPQRSDFSTVAALVDWPATLSRLVPRKDEIVEEYLVWGTAYHGKTF